MSFYFKKKNILQKNNFFCLQLINYFLRNKYKKIQKMFFWESLSINQMKASHHLNLAINQLMNNWQWVIENGWVVNKRIWLWIDWKISFDLKKIQGWTIDREIYANIFYTNTRWQKQIIMSFYGENVYHNCWNTNFLS